MGCQIQLVDRHVQPTVELAPRFFQGAGVLEAHLSVQRDADFVAAVDDAHHQVKTLGPCLLDELLKQGAPQAFAAVVSVNVDRVLDGVLVGREGAERP